jgi:hypothetical protein
MAAVRTAKWVLVVPVKRLAAAKSRLRGALPDTAHERLALALAQDTVAAAVRCAEVVVVTADSRAGAALATLRRDVDTADDLALAEALGLGPHTTALLRPHRRADRAGYAAGMQGTVATYDAETRSGTLLLDDGSEVSFPTGAFDASGLRLLRLGQRVRIDHDESGQVVRVTLPTLQ